MSQQAHLTPQQRSPTPDIRASFFCEGDASAFNLQGAKCGDRSCPGLTISSFVLLVSAHISFGKCRCVHSLTVTACPAWANSCKPTNGDKRVHAQTVDVTCPGNCHQDSWTGLLSFGRMWYAYHDCLSQLTLALATSTDRGPDAWRCGTRRDQDRRGGRGGDLNCT